MSSENNQIINKYYKLNKLYMSSIGLWPYQNKSVARVMSFIWVFQNISIMIPEVFGTWKVRRNINEVIESICYLTYNIIVEIKFWNSIRNNEKIECIIKNMQNNWKNVKNKKELDLLTQYTSFGKLLATGYTCLCYFTLFVYLLLFLTPRMMDVIKPLNESRPLRLIFFVDYFIDEDKYFIHIMAHCYITTILSLFCLIACDIFYGTSVQHACGLLAILRHRLETIKVDGFDDPSVNDLHQQIKSNIIYHINIIRFCEYIDDLYSDSFFFTMGLGVMMLSISGVMTILGRGLNMIRYGLFTVAQIYHVYCYCVQGQMLTNESITMCDCIYDSDWYKLPLRTQKLIAIMIMRSNKPIQLTAKYFFISLASFSQAMRKSMSYFTVLRSAQ